MNARNRAKLRTSSLMLTAVLAASGCGGGSGGDADGAAGGLDGPTAPAPTYTVGGTVSGLIGTLVLQNNDGAELSVSSNGSFTFAGTFSSGADFSVTIVTQPAGQTCIVAAGTGTVSGNVTGVTVTCTTDPPSTFTIGGTVAGLAGTVILQNNGGDNRSLSTNGAFAFANAVTSGAGYSVTVLTQPAGQVCTVSNGSGVASGNVSNIAVACVTTGPAVAYTVGGTVSGLSGTLVLLNNGSNSLAVAGNGAFSFSSALAAGATYAVTIQSQPIGQTCTVTNGSGVANANVSNVTVTCVATVAAIDLIANTSVIVADGVSKPTLSVTLRSSAGTVIPESSASYALHVDGAIQSSMNFTTTRAGSYSLTVIAGSVVSNAVTVTARENRNYPLATLPVVFHVVHFGEATGSASNLSATEIGRLLDVLNRSYSNQIGSTDPNAVDTRIRFRLAVKDPDDAPLGEAGIRRLNGTSYDTGGGVSADVAGDRQFGPNESWRLRGVNFWDPRKYVNVFVLPLYGGESVATLPRMYASSALPGLETEPDGCGYCEPYSEWFYAVALDTSAREYHIAHEMGHFLGLLHPQSYGTCGPGDYVSDTFNYVIDITGVPACPGNEGTNTSTTIMDYRGPHNTFTYGQRERLQLVLNGAVWIDRLTQSTQ
jgi:hypothetical protein